MSYVFDCSIDSPILMLVSQIFELASHCLVYSNDKHTKWIFQFEDLLDQSVLAASSVCENWIIFLTWTV